MNKEFIPYEQALELKELGFNENCFCSWMRNDYIVEFRKIHTEDKNYLSAPLYQQAFRFFREKYKLASYIQADELAFEDGYIYSYEIPKLDIINDEYKNTYEEAELECLKKLIEIVKTK